MVVVESGGKEFYIDGYLQANLDIAKNAVHKDWDMVFVVDGIEGSGKSVLGLQVCKYCDAEFTEDDVAFNPEQFIEKIKNAGKYRAVLYDESFGGLNSRSAISKVNKILVGMIAEIRQKNLFVVIVQPSFFEVDRYVALHRARGLLHVYTGDNLQRGRFAFYSQKKLKILFQLGKKFYSYSKPASDFVGSFTNTYPIDEQAYRSAKHKALMAHELEKQANVVLRCSDELAFKLLDNMKNDGKSWPTIGEELGKVGETLRFFYTRYSQNLLENLATVPKQKPN